MILDHVSHSQLSMWDRCARQWEYRYVKGLKIAPSGALVLGGSYHKALEVNFRQKIRTLEDLPIDVCLDAFSDDWEKRLVEEVGIEWGSDRPGKVKDLGVGLVAEYMNTTSFAVQPIRVEETFVKTIAGVRFVLRMDLQDINKIVVDHKTSARAYNQGDVDKDPQASATAFALGRPIVYYNHIALKTKVPRIQIIRTYRLAEDIEWWLEKATLNIAQMRTGIAPPRTDGWHCSPSYCGFWELCRGELTRKTFE